MAELGLRVKQAREEADLSREALAVAANITFESLYRIETGKNRTFRPDVLVRIANATGKPPGWFFEGMLVAATVGVLG